MPFNRADYYISTTVDRPTHCAQGTGVLVKAIVSQANGGFNGLDMLPLLDCVADMQVVTYLDTNVDGQWETMSNGLNLGSALNVREQLKEVHLYILAHEGLRDMTYTQPSNIILVGQSAILGRNFDLTTLADPDWQHYRWKVYRLIVRPDNLR
jgi:hypothetical protein